LHLKKDDISFLSLHCRSNQAKKEKKGVPNVVRRAPAHC